MLSLHYSDSYYFPDKKGEPSLFLFLHPNLKENGRNQKRSRHRPC